MRKALAAGVALSLIAAAGIAAAAGHQVFGFSDDHHGRSYLHVQAGPDDDDGPGPGMMPPWMGQGMMGGMRGHGPGMGPGGPGGPGGPRFEKMCSQLDARVAGRLAFAETALKLTADQQAAWSTLKTAVNNALAPIRKDCDTLKDKPMPTSLPERLERMEQMHTTRLTVLQSIRPAITTFYQTLTAEQKQIADTMHPMGHRF